MPVLRSKKPQLPRLWADSGQDSKPGGLKKGRPGGGLRKLCHAAQFVANMLLLIFILAAWLVCFDFKIK
jgi:hypothetical protein